MLCELGANVCVAKMLVTRDGYRERLGEGRKQERRFVTDCVRVCVMF